MSKRSKMLSYVAKHSKQRKTTKVIKLQWIASIWHQNDLKCWVTSQNYKCDHITMNLHRFDVKTITTTQNYESDQIIMHCINLTSKRSKKLSYVPKLQKKSNYNELHGFDVKTIRNVELRRKTFKTTQNYKTTKVIKLQWIASIWCQKHQTNAKLQKWSYFDEFQSIWRQNYQNIWVRSQNYKSNQITMDCIDLTSKRSRMLRYVAKHSKQRKTTNEIKLQWICIDLTSERSKMLSYVAKLQMWSYYDEFASIWRQNDHNNAKLRKWSNYNELHRFDVKTI